VPADPLPEFRRLIGRVAARDIEAWLENLHPRGRVDSAAVLRGLSHAFVEKALWDGLSKEVLRKELRLVKAVGRAIGALKEHELSRTTAAVRRALRGAVPWSGAPVEDAYEEHLAHLETRRPRICPMKSNAAAQ
jgi:hypothetical protein